MGPICHYMMGGVKVHAETQASTLPGLFAAGEVAAGLHGANRLGGNSLSDLVVFGKRAGEYAAEYAGKKNGFPKIDPKQVAETVKESLEPFERSDGANPYSIFEDLQQMMQNKVGIVRNEPELSEALEELDELRKRAANVKIGGNIQFNPGWHLALDLKNLLDVSEAVARAALQRRESRGAHTREDYPGSDPEWGKFNLVARLKTSGIQIERIPLPPVPPELKALLDG